jgi:amphiphysin
LTQNTLLAQYYTTLHNYCTEEGLPSPAPHVQDIVGEWDGDFKRIQQEVESINTIARGKAVHAPMQLGDDTASRRGSSMSGLNLRNSLAARKANPQSLSRLGGKFSAGASRIYPSSRTADSSQALESHREHDEPEADNLSVYPSTPSYSPAGPVRDYFQGQDSQSTRNNSSAIAAKKKAPPPPPKRIQSSKEQWVTALYTFTGQESDDLAFQEGDRIRVVKRTDSIEDWWDGELRGVRGRFPANYVEL